ncbi:hypothetical protein AWZ03_012565 [Drosophila navojoa]|uniref:Uncharacterized protein n=1 Tax=Drosophila navojoa TaxID=7232 RepID=A0A484AWM8_DRONA|nr:hypothetical protein AWZ03_012565 [Drosophila navojoa]
MSNSSGLQLKQLEQQLSPKCRSDEDASGMPEEVELALHAKPGLSRTASADDLTPKSPLAPIVVAGIAEQPIGIAYIEDLPGSSWERVMRAVSRCLMYCIDRVAAGFGLSRQQTTWYKHCWDSPPPQPRGISFLGATEMFVVPATLTEELADNNNI